MSETESFFFKQLQVNTYMASKLTHIHQKPQLMAGNLSTSLPNSVLTLTLYWPLLVSQAHEQQAFYKREEQNKTRWKFTLIVMCAPLIQFVVNIYFGVEAYIHNMASISV